MVLTIKNKCAILKITFWKRRILMKNTRDVGNRLAPFFKAHGFKRKSNKFYKIQNNIILCFGLDRPGGLYFLSYILPLYIPTSIPHITYGGRFDDFEPFPVKNFSFDWDEPSQLEEFVERVMECCEKYYFPLYDIISTPEGLMLFLNKGYKFVKTFFGNLPRMYFYKLRIYTNFVLSRYDDMLADIPLMYKDIDSWPISEENKINTKKEYEVLADLRFASDKEKEEFIQNTIEQSMIACKFKY